MSPTSRAKTIGPRNIGRFQAAANAGILIGPALGGFGMVAAGWVGIHDPRAPFWVAAALAFANSLFGLFVMPESLEHSRRARFSWRRANPVGAIALLFSRPGLMGMALIFFLLQFANSSFNSIFQFYTHYRFNWGPPNVAVLLMVLERRRHRDVQLRRRAGGGSIGRAGRGAGWRWALRRSLSSQSGLAATVPLFWTAIAVIVISGFGFPSLFSLLSKRVGVDQQGQLQGALQILFGLTGLVGPITFTNLFAWAIGPGKAYGLPGLPILVGGALTFGAFLMAVVYARPAVDVSAWPRRPSTQSRSSPATRVQTQCALSDIRDLAARYVRSSRRKPGMSGIQYG